MRQIIMITDGKPSALTLEDGGLDNGAYEAIPIRIPPSGTRVRAVFARKFTDVDAAVGPGAQLQTKMGNQAQLAQSPASIYP